MPRQHRLQAAYPDLWNAIDGAIRDAVACHSDIIIPDKRRASITKRAVGLLLGLKGLGVGKPTDSPDG
jgi:hypothetical protein